MTDEEILALSIEDLEWNIADKMLGLHIHQEQTDGKLYISRSPMCHQWQELPKYARDIKAAKVATDAVLATWFSLGLNVYCGYGPDGRLYSAVIGGVIFPGAREVCARAEAATEEEARARAALMAYWQIKKGEKP
jgi:hypothetical protein